MRIPKFLIPLTLILSPLFFLLALQFLFDIQNFATTLKLAEQIKNAIMQKNFHFKFEVWLSFFIAFIPFLSTIYLIRDKVGKTTHGKAKWATEKDIECYKFSFKKLFGSLFSLLSIFLLYPLFTKKFWKNLPKNILNIFNPFEKQNPMSLNYGKGFILGLTRGFFSFQRKVVCYDKRLASLVVAPPGSGKTTGVVVPNLLSLPTSCIITDIKGELCELTAGYREKAFKNKILIFNPLGEDNTCFFNPFAYKIVKKLDFNKKKKLVDEIGNTIFQSDPNNKNDDHWITRAKDLFVFYALYDLCTKNSSNFYDIAMGNTKDYTKFIPPFSPYHRQVFKYNKQENKDGLVKYTPILDEKGNYVTNTEREDSLQKLFFQQVSEQRYANPNNPNNWENQTDEEIQEELNAGEELLDEIVKNMARGWAEANEKEFQSIQSVFDKVMSVFKSYPIKEATSGMSFEYEDFRKENISLYIKIPQTEIESLSSLVRIVLESIAKNLMDRESSKEDERVYFLLDEFVRFGKLPFLLEMPSLCRSYGVIPLFVTQSYSLIIKYYSQDDLKILNEIIGYKIVFVMNDPDSAEMLSKEIGEYTRHTISQSTRENSLIFGGNSTYGYEGARLVPAQDIINLDSNEVIVLATGHKAKPLRLYAYHYYKYPKFTKRIKLPYTSIKDESIIKDEVLMLEQQTEERAERIRKIAEAREQKNKEISDEEEEKAKQFFSSSGVGGALMQSSEPIEEENTKTSQEQNQEEEQKQEQEQEQAKEEKKEEPKEESQGTETANNDSLKLSFRKLTQQEKSEQTFTEEEERKKANVRVYGKDEQTLMKPKTQTPQAEQTTQTQSEEENKKEKSESDSYFDENEGGSTTYKSATATMEAMEERKVSNNDDDDEY